MSSTELFTQARALGEALARHERVASFLAARDALTRDAQAQRLMQDYQRHAERLDQLAHERKPIEVADKRTLAELEGQLSTNACVKEFMRRQADYLELMNHVYAEIEGPLAGPPPATQ